MDGGEAARLRLVRGDLGGAQLADGDAVLPAALDQGVQAGQLLAAGGDDQLARDLVRDAVLRAEPDHLGGAARRVPGLEGAGAVVDAAVDDAAVAARLVAGRALLLLQHRHADARALPGQRVRRRQPDDPGADHHHVGLVPHAHHLPAPIVACAADVGLKPLAR